MNEDIETTIRLLREDASAGAIGEYLGYLEEEDVRALADSLKHENEGVRERAMQVLGKSANLYALDAVMRFYDDASPRVRSAALMAAHDRGGDPDPLSQDKIGGLILTDPDINVRRNAISVLGLSHTPRVRDHLHRALGEPSLPAHLRRIVEVHLAGFGE